MAEGDEETWVEKRSYIQDNAQRELAGEGLHEMKCCFDDSAGSLEHFKDQE